MKQWVAYLKIIVFIFFKLKFYSEFGIKLKCLHVCSLLYAAFYSK